MTRRARPWGRLAGPVTAEGAYWRRREILRAMGFAGVSALLGTAGCSDGPRIAGAGSAARPMAPARASAAAGPFPARRNGHYTGDRPLTPEDVAGSFNNFYEFSEDKEKVQGLAAGLRTDGWKLVVDGLVDRPRTFSLADLLALPHEERVYRFRCVEAWAMTVPWSGVPLANVLRACGPKPAAKFVRFVSFLAPDQAPNQQPGLNRYPWPYFEALRIDEAMHELAFLATGIYGHALPPQHGAPVRMVVPWKYGYKGAKSIVRIELVAEQPHTFWNDLEPKEYSFQSNVEPDVPHPRWSQATERVIGTGDRRPTLPYNGYAELVAGLYG